MADPLVAVQMSLRFGYNPCNHFQINPTRMGGGISLKIEISYIIHFCAYFSYLLILTDTPLPKTFTILKKICFYRTGIQQVLISVKITYFFPHFNFFFYTYIISY